MYFMLNGEYPFSGESIPDDIKQKCDKEGGFDYKSLVEQSKNANLKSATHEVCDFFRKVFTMDPEKRISDRDIKIFAQVSKYFSEQTLSFIN